VIARSLLLFIVAVIVGGGGVVGGVGCDKGATPSPSSSASTPPSSDPSLKPQTPRPPSVKREHIQAAEAVIAQLEVLGIALEQAPDCAAAAREVDAASNKIGGLGEAMKRTIEETNADPAARAWFEENYKARMQQASKPFVLRAQACINDPAFKAALDRMPMLRKQSA
jgi:hypothetical protein